MKNADTREINAVITATPGWKKAVGALHFGPYGTQRGFVRSNISSNNSISAPKCEKMLSNIFFAGNEMLEKMLDGMLDEKAAIFAVYEDFLRLLLVF